MDVQDGRVPFQPPYTYKPGAWESSAVCSSLPLDQGSRREVLCGLFTW